MVVDSDLKLSESPMEPVNVIYQTAEDGLGDTIKPRLLVAGADCSRVMVIDDREQPLTMLNIINLRKKWKGICSQVPFIVLKYRQGCI